VNVWSLNQPESARPTRNSKQCSNTEVAQPSFATLKMRNIDNSVAKLLQHGGDHALQHVVVSNQDRLSSGRYLCQNTSLG